ncbi:MAG: alanine--tRNA ligase [Brevinematia bacterium]
MKNLSSRDIRKIFLEFFASKGHKIVESSSLIPADDPTLLFTTAGMVQFKPYFLREKVPPFTRATSVQKCLRAGGKASDLENVGKTPRHHTFFEMLGNFSFGDYFKEEAIEFAWEFITEVLEIDKDLLYISIYKDDDEAFEIWHKKIGLEENRIVRLGEKDNFWGPPGEEGPCGPCSEIYIDLRDRWGYDKENCRSLEDCDGFLEFWNLVFMQYHQDRNRQRKELEFKGIDTGMGLERLAMILQNKNSVYETDVFEPIIRKISDETGKKYEGENIIAMNIIADHTRAITFVGAEGVYPSNEGRGYVIRRILRRALRYANKIGINEPIIYKVIDGVVDSMGDTYPEIKDKKDMVKKVIKVEEEKYYKTLSNGISYLNEVINKVKELGNNLLPGDEVFKLYDSMGVSIDLIEDICHDEGIRIDWEQFNKLMEEQKQRGKMSWRKGEEKLDFSTITKQENPTKYVGDEFEEYESNITKIYLKDGSRLIPSEEIKEGEVGIIVVEETPFYGEGGGQVGDSGLIILEENVALVIDTQKDNDVYLHIARIDKGRFKVGDKVKLSVDIERKKNIAKHHTATHILHYSLRKVLGEHVAQSGSLVEPNRLRFDFSHYSSLTEEEIKKVEEEANEVVLKDIEVQKQYLPKNEAIKRGALAFFGDKYGEIVRVIEIPGFSKELCGGTHVKRTGEIGLIKIIDERSVASGVRRIEAVAGKAALREFSKYQSIVKLLSKQLGTTPEEITSRIENLIKRVKELEKNKSQKTTNISLDEVTKEVNKIGNYNLIIKIFDNADTNILASLVDKVKENINDVVVMLISKNEENINFVFGTNSNVNLQNIIKELNSLGVKGGGRQDFIRGAIQKSSNLDEISKKLISLLSKP